MMIEVTCDLCGRPMTVQASLRAKGKARFHWNCAQTLRALGRRNPNYKGGRSYDTEKIKPEMQAKIHERDGNQTGNKKIMALR